MTSLIGISHRSPRKQLKGNGESHSSRAGSDGSLLARISGGQTWEERCEESNHHAFKLTPHAPRWRRLPRFLIPFNSLLRTVSRKCWVGAISRRVCDVCRISHCMSRRGLPRWGHLWTRGRSHKTWNKIQVANLAQEDDHCANGKQEGSIGTAILAEDIHEKDELQEQLDRVNVTLTRGLVASSIGRANVDRRPSRLLSHHTHTASRCGHPTRASWNTLGPRSAIGRGNRSSKYRHREYIRLSTPLAHHISVGGERIFLAPRKAAWLSAWVLRR
mmetsp:Transcript_37044/g.83843  ORF Transcript_37044/g.83843 Transcript_37044/m.83843 type:complete len:274 (-) Transcript_37044:601-1422(-)